MKKIITPFNVYLAELYWKLIYIFISFILTFLIIFYFIDIFLLLEVYPFVKLIFKNLIATHITELFDSVINTCCFISYICIFPFVSFQVCSFFSTTFYSYQLNFFKFFCITIFLVWSLIFLTCYNFLLPQFFNFFTQWEIKKCNSFFNLELNAKIQYYLIWVNNIYSFLSFLFLLALFGFILSFLCLRPNNFFYILKYYRKYLCFFLVCTLYILTPPDYIFQLFLLVLSFIICEFLFFFFCFRYQQCQFPDSSIG